MAGSATAATRKRPRKSNTSTNGEAVNDEAQTNDDASEEAASEEAAEPKAEGRGKAQYHLYEEDEDGVTLRKLGDDADKTYEGRNATEAIEAYIDDGNDAEGITFVVIPNRNLARVKADVETKTKVKLSPA